jgi:branched-chain amino acid transport system substrate-binding protein
MGAVAGGIGAFASEFGRRTEGVLAPSQWEEGVPFAVDVGPRSMGMVRALQARVLPTLSAGAGTGHVEYPCAQAYAAVLVALRCVEESGSLDDGALLAAARSLRCTTFFGRFGLGDDGRQSDHDLLVLQWRAGVKHVVWPPDRADTELETRPA